MKDNLEDTRALNELVEEVKQNELNYDLGDTIEVVEQPKNNIEEEKNNNLITKEEEPIEEKKEEVIEEKIVVKKSLKDKWNNLSKKSKITIIVCCIVILLLIIGTILYILLSKKEKPIDKPIEEEIIVTKDNYIYQNGKLILIDDNENHLGEYECTNKDENNCYVAYIDNSEDLFETPINEYEDGTSIKKRTKIYANKYAFIVDQKDSKTQLITLYDFIDNKVIGEYLNVKVYNNSDNVILVNKNNEYGLFELKEDGLKEIIGFKYAYLGINGSDTTYLVAKNNKGYYLIDYKDKAKTKVISNPIINYNDSYIVTKNNDKYYLIDYNNEEFLSDYDYIRLVDKDKVAVVKDNQVYIKSVNESKYNEEGYQLNNDNYRVVNVYDKDNKKVSSKEAFTTQINNNVLSLFIDKDTLLIDLTEGEASKNYNYFNYFDGKLYFYKDEEKNELIGTYECNNKNEIKDNVLTNCYVAKDTVLNDTYVNPKREAGYNIPIYNNNYVFIYDSPTLVNDSNKEIKFYDLKQKKVLGTYTDIDSNTKSTNGVTQIETDNTSVIAKLKSGKYGVININSNGASVQYKFNYNYLEKYGNYYLGQKENNKWAIIYSDDNTSYEFNERIMDNNSDYVVVGSSEKVKIYPNKNNADPINNKEFVYIELSTKVYGAVDSENKLWLYKYDSNEPLNKDGIGLTSKVYYATDTPSFKIQTTGDDVNVKVYNGSNYVDFGPYPLTAKTVVEEIIDQVLND